MNLEDIVEAWPALYHVTYAINLPLIRRRRQLQSAAALFAEAGVPDLASCRRTDDVSLTIEGHSVRVRNQCPLRPESVDIENGSFTEYIVCLNSRIFFWPGSGSGLVGDGVRMFERSEAGSVMLRVDTRSLLHANGTGAVFLSRCNAGAAWIEGGRRSRRGAHVFEPLVTFAQPVAGVAEIAFRQPVTLPADTSYAGGADGPWQRLFP